MKKQKGLFSHPGFKNTTVINAFMYILDIRIYYSLIDENHSKCRKTKYILITGFFQKKYKFWLEIFLIQDFSTSPQIFSTET